jgi:glutamine amidotransferase
VIAIVDYGAGNLASVSKGLRAAGASPRIVKEPAELDGATGVVIPGVGHFGATRALDEEWRAALRDSIARGRPLLGICLGMQFLFAGSEEAAETPGLGVFDERLVRLTGDVKVPHVGWNTLDSLGTSPLLDSIREGDAVYFTHSYVAPIGRGTIASSSHGAAFASIVEQRNVSGMQFHPEKSGAAGLTLLRNWVRQCSASA